MSQKTYDQLNAELNQLSETMKNLDAERYNRENNQNLSEDRIIQRLVMSERYLSNQMEDQAFVSTFITVVFVMTALYVFYQMVEFLLHKTRCKCLNREEIKSASSEAFDEFAKGNLRKDEVAQTEVEPVVEQVKESVPAN